MEDAMALEITKDNFEQEVAQSQKPVLVDFWAEWCPPCRMLGPIVEEVEKETPAIKVGKVNVDKEGALAERFGIMSIPTLILFKEGKEAKRTLGAMPKEDLLKFTAL
jgi:thioredoxin 1